MTHSDTASVDVSYKQEPLDNSEYPPDLGFAQNFLTLRVVPLAQSTSEQSAILSTVVADAPPNQP